MAIKFLSGASIPNIASGSILKVDANGNIVAAVSGTDYDTSAGQWTGTNGGIYYSSNVRIGTYSTSVAPSAKLHVFDYQTTDPKLLIEDGNTGDASMEFKISTQSYTMGIDNSDADKFVFAASTALGTTNVLEISTTGLAAFQTDVLVNGDYYLANGNRTLSVKLATTPSTGDVGVQFRAGSGDYLGLAAGGGTGTGLVIDSSNKVGIGTASPATDLSVGSASHTSPDDTDRILNWYSSTGGTEVSNSSHYITVGQNSSNTSQPKSVGLALFNPNQTNNTYSPAITFGGLSTSGNYMSGAAAIATKLISNADNNFRGGDLTFYTSGLSMATRGLNEKMRITAGGNVGIGTTAPLGKVDIQYDMDVDTGSATGLTSGLAQYGNINFSGVTAQAAGAAVTTMQGITWQVNNYGGTTDYGNQAQLVVGNNGSVGTFMGFFTSANYSNAPVERLRIDSDGKVGIGTANPAQKLHVAGDIYTTSDFRGNSIISANAALTISNTGIQPDQGSVEDIVAFNFATTKVAHIDTDGYIHAVGFKTNTAATGFLKANGTVDTDDFFSGVYADLSSKPTLGTMAAAATSDYKTSDQTETYVATELGSYTLTSALGTAATTAASAYATAAQGTTADSALQAETFSATDVVFTINANDVIAGDDLLIAGGLTWTNSTKTLSSANDNTTYTAGTGLTLTGTSFSLTGSYLPLGGGTMTGHILLNNGIELRSKDTGSAVRTITRVNSSNELEYGWSGAGAVKFMGGGAYTERMRIHTNGNVGIGTPSPSSKLEVVGSGGTVLDIQGSAGQLFSVTDSLTGDLFAVSDISGIPILNVNSSGAVDIDGTLAVDGNIGMTTGNSTGKFAVMSTSVHASYDFYNNGTTYLNGAVTVDSAFTQTGAAASTFSGTLAASNLSGTNTGDQDLSGYSTASGVEDNADVTDATNVAAAGALMKAGGTMTGDLQLDANLKFATRNVTSYTYANADSGGLYIETVGSTDALSDMRFQARASGAGNYASIAIKPSDQSILLRTNGTTALTLDSSQNATLAGKLYIGSVAATATAVTGLFLGASGEVKKRALGSNAFNSTAIPTGTASGQNVADFVQDFGTTAQTSINTLGNASGKYRWNNTTTGRPAAAQDNEYGTLLHLHYSGNEITQIAHDHAENQLWVRTLNTESDTGTTWKQIADEVYLQNTYAALASPALTGTPTAPTAGATVNTTQLATTAFVQTAVSNLVDSSPAALNTLNELAAALGDDASFSTTVATSIGTKLPLAGGTLTSTGTSSSPVLEFVNSSSATFNHTINAFAPNLTSGENNILVVGRAGSTKNSGYIGYRYSSAGSNDNVLTFGHWGSDNLMNLTGDGKLGIGVIAPTAKLQVGPGTTSTGRSGVASLGGADDSLLSILSLVNTSGNNTVGSGVALDFHLAENYSPTGRVATVAESTTVHAGLAFYTYQGGLTEKMRITNAGTIKFNSYGAGILKTNASGVISLDTNTYSTATGVEDSADVTDTANVVAALTAGTNVQIAEDGTISSTDTDTTYSVGDNGLTAKNFTSTLKTKLDSIAAGATTDQTLPTLSSLGALPLAGGTMTGTLQADVIKDSLYLNAGNSGWKTKKWVRNVGVSGGSINQKWVKVLDVPLTASAYTKTAVKMKIHGYDDVSSGTENIDVRYENASTAQEYHEAYWYTTDNTPNIFSEVRSIRYESDGLTNSYQVWVKMAGDWRDTFTVEAEYWISGTDTISFPTEAGTATAPSGDSNDIALTTRSWKLNNSSVYIGSAQVATQSYVTGQGYQTSQRAISSTPTDGATTTAISSDWAFDNVKTAVPANAVFTDTVNTFDGAYGSLSGLPALGSAALTSANAYATSTQGTTADNALPKAGGTMTGALNASGGLYFVGDSNMGFVPHPIGGQFRSDSSNITGCVIVKLPTDIGNTPDDMISFHVDIYDYTTSEMVSVYVGGYTYRTTSTSVYWYNCTAIVTAKKTDRNFTVRFGNDGTNFYVAIGETTTTWAHPSIVVRDFQGSYRSNITHYIDGWDVSINSADLEGVDETQSNNFPASDYNKIINAPTLGTAAATASTAYATSAQGTTADAALPKAGGTMSGDLIVQTGITVGAAETNDPYIKFVSTSAIEGTKIWYDNSVGDTYFDNIYSQGTQTSPAIRFRTNVYGVSNALIDALTIVHNGNVGIGTNNPEAKFQVNGDVLITSALLSNQENIDVDSSAAETVAQVAHATYTAAFFDFVIKNGTNVRAGTVYSCHDGTNVEFTETSTVDLGDTSDVSLSVDISGTNMRLRATTTSDNWIVKSLVRAI